VEVIQHLEGSKEISLMAICRFSNKELKPRLKDKDIQE
jgi:hypothetical protein